MSENLSVHLNNTKLKLIMFGGKGGSGKTTAACASAIHISLNRPEVKVLLISTDPAHSLGDSFDIRIGNQITSIEAVPGLSALEIDASQLLNNFKQRYGAAILILAERGTYFDQVRPNDCARASRSVTTSSYVSAVRS